MSFKFGVKCWLSESDSSENEGDDYDEVICCRRWGDAYLNYGKSTVNQGKEHNCWKVHSVGYIAVADNRLRVYIFIRLAVVASQICEIPRNSPKIQQYSSSRSSNAIDLSANRKRICNFLSVKTLGVLYLPPLSRYAFCSKIACFQLHPRLTPLAEERLAISTYSIYHWKVHLMSYNSVADNIGPSSLVWPLLAPKSAKSRAIPRKLEQVKL